MAPDRVSDGRQRHCDEECKMEEGPGRAGRRCYANTVFFPWSISDLPFENRILTGRSLSLSLDYDDHERERKNTCRHLN